MHDNTLARALRRLGVDAQLIPTYAPIRTDEEDVSGDRIFFGGINVFLEQKIPVYRYLPSFVGSLLDSSWLIRWAASRSSATNPRLLGALTVSMLRGAAGYQRKEVEKLCRWLRRSVKPRLIVFSNLLIAGCAGRLRSALHVPLLVTLQGDDAFLDSLPEPYQSRALAEIRRLVAQIDGFLVHSRYYAAFMQEYLGIPAEKFHLVPLGMDTSGFPAPAREGGSAEQPPHGSRREQRIVGYLARLAPSKGLHVLVDAFIELRKREKTRDVLLHIAGWLSASDRPYAEIEFNKLRAAGLNDAYQYAGVVDRREKLKFLRGIDVLSVPTTYRDPKGLFVLEALAAGVPVVQPAHGAFPELLADLGGGRLVPPNDPLRLADALEDLLRNEAARQRLGRQGAQAVHSRFNAEAMARATWEVCQRFLDD
jgi:glycosyltransferase involved in cell wall biosynthesis